MQLDQAILQHLEAQPIQDQGTLLSLLHGEGFDLTLSTLSRRLQRLQVRKVGGVYRPRGLVLPASIAGLRGETPAIRRVDPCLLILKTQPGQAQALAVAMDQAGLPSLAGSVSGYDTIFMAPIEASRLGALEEEVRRFLA